MSDDAKRYSEREVGLILKRVAELHERDGEVESPRAMTKGEIEDVVAELGISKALVARAASELATKSLTHPRVWWLGGKTHAAFESRIDGKIDAATYDRMLELLRRSFSQVGNVTEQGSARIWSTTRAVPRDLTFTVHQLDDHTTLRLEERMPIDARTTVGGTAFAGFGTGVVAAIPLKVLLGKAMLLMALPGLMFASAALGWTIGREIWRRRSTAREHQLRTVFAELVALAAQGRRLALDTADDGDTMR